MEDADLVQRAAGGDAVAFELLVRRHTDALWRLARLLLDDRFAAEEAVSDACYRAYRALGQYRGEAPVRAWLLAICRRVCLDRLRLHRPEVVSLDAARARAGREDQADLRIALGQALQRLDAGGREAFILVDVLGYSGEEAAAVVGVPASTLRSRLGRARERLADQLRDHTVAKER